MGKLKFILSLFASPIVKEGADVVKLGMKNKLKRHFVKHGIAYVVISIFGIAMFIAILAGNQELANKIFDFLAALALDSL